MRHGRRSISAPHPRFAVRCCASSRHHQGLATAPLHPPPPPLTRREGLPGSGEDNRGPSRPSDPALAASSGPAPRLCKEGLFFPTLLGTNPIFPPRKVATAVSQLPVLWREGTDRQGTLSLVHPSGAARAGKGGSRRWRPAWGGLCAREGGRWPVTVAAPRLTVLCSGAPPAPPQGAAHRFKVDFVLCLWRSHCPANVDVGNCHQDTAR